MIVSLDADGLDIPDDYYTALSDVIEAACDRYYVELSPRHQLYFFEYYKINKVGGANNPYTCMHGPGYRSHMQSLTCSTPKTSLSTSSTTTEARSNTSYSFTRGTKREEA